MLRKQKRECKMWMGMLWKSKTHHQCLQIVAAQMELSDSHNHRPLDQKQTAQASAHLELILHNNNPPTELLEHTQA
eukprot:2410688-Amphidinium_carterae.1